MSFFAFFLTYLIGGVTFIPLLLGLLLLHAFITFPRKDEQEAAEKPAKDLPAPQVTGADVAAGYFTVQRDFAGGLTSTKPTERPQSTFSGSAVATESPSVYQTMYRSVFERNKTQGPTSPTSGIANTHLRNVFYVVLR
jgi:hypothetical protein